jgi:hypothetical protein
MQLRLSLLYTAPRSLTVIHIFKLAQLKTNNPANTCAILSVTPLLISGAGIESHVPGSLSGVQYAEPTWLSHGYHSPYFKDHHRRFQTAVRKFVEEVVFPDAQACERGGGRPSQQILDEMARLNIIAMGVGPGKHLEGRVLMDGIISVEQVGSPQHSSSGSTYTTFSLMPSTSSFWPKNSPGCMREVRVVLLNMPVLNIIAQVTMMDLVNLNVHIQHMNADHAYSGRNNHRFVHCTRKFPT